MSQNQQARVIKVNPKEPIKLFDCNILGLSVKDSRAKDLKIKEDLVSTELAKIDLVKEVKLADYDHWAKGDSVAEHLVAMASMRDLPLNPRHAEVLFQNPELYPDAWKGGVGNRIYVGFPGAVVYPANSTEPMIVMLWWNGFGVSRTYTSRAGENRQSKFYMATFVGNPFAAK